MDSNRQDASSLTALREQLAEVDGNILQLVARRQSIATEIGRTKATTGRATRDYAQEKDVVGRARRIEEVIADAERMAVEHA